MGRRVDRVGRVTARVAVYEHPPARAVRVRRGGAAARAGPLPAPPNDVRSLVRACRSRDLAVPAGAAALASRVRVRRPAHGCGAREHDGSASSTTRLPPRRASTSASRSSSPRPRSGSSLALATRGRRSPIRLSSSSSSSEPGTTTCSTASSARSTFVLAAAVASRLVPARARRAALAQTGGIASIAIGYALIAWGFVSLDLTALGPGSILDAMVLPAGVAAVVAPRVGEEPLVETR